MCKYEVLYSTNICEIIKTHTQECLTYTKSINDIIVDLPFPPPPLPPLPLLVRVALHPVTRNTVLQSGSLGSGLHLAP